MSDTENATTTSIIYNASGMIVFAVWGLFSGWGDTENPLDFLLLVSIGLCASFQQLFLATAYRYGEASLLAPFEYVILVLAAATGFLFWNEVPPLTSIVGGLVIVGSGLIIYSRNRASRMGKSEDV